MKRYTNITLLWLLILLSINLSAQTTNSDRLQSAKNNDAQTVEAKADIINIDKVNKEITSTQELIILLESYVTVNQWANIDSAFSKMEVFLQQEAEDFEALDQATLSKFFLENLRLAWGSYQRSIQVWKTKLENNLSKSVDYSEKLHEKSIILNNFIVQAQDNNLHALVEQMKNEQRYIDSISTKLNTNQQILLSLQARVDNKNLLCNRVLTKINKLESTLIGQTFKKTQGPIWEITLKNTIQDGLLCSLKRAYRNNYKSMSYYASNLSNGMGQYILLALLIMFSILFIRKTYISKGFTHETPGHAGIERVLIKHPGIIIFTFLATLWTYSFPFIPMLFSDFLLFILLLFIGIILKQFMNLLGLRVLKTLIFLIFLNILEALAWYLGDYSRLYLMMETLVGIILVLPFYKLYTDKSSVKEIRILRYTRVFFPIILSLYVVSFIANLLGFINLTVLFIKIGIRTAAITTIAFGYARILENISLATLSILDTRFPDILIKYEIVIKKRINLSIRIIIIYLWIEALLRVFEIKLFLHSLIGDIFSSEASVGSISFSLNDVLSFTGILIITYLIVTFIKTIIEEEILRKIKLPRGIPAAISMTLRISIVTLGILFAISSTGINMSSFGMIAGALGVGIGFGLQNIVQNFISGLILIFERPIQVGDTVEVDNLMGKVKDIGVRASNVVTYDGAEVVVPNSNLIANNLINWTLSDSRKRVEINVGAAYGSNPNEILEILFKVANNHPDVVKNPEPRALFDGFGDSSLDFRLLFWVNFELGLSAKSDVLVGIYNAFAKHNIEIPFPQVDLHVKDIAKEEPIAPKVPKFEKKENPKGTKKESIIEADDDGSN